MSPTDGTEPIIRVTRDGPYRVEGQVTVTDASGHVVCEEGTRYLCRCGGSRHKPLCDGTHGKNGFGGTETADHDRIEDRREALPGRGITIYDDRSRCAHIGRCTDGLPEVFRLGQEPWIDADAASAEKISSVVRRCPSGALAYAMGDDPEPIEERAEPEIIALPDASLRIRGAIPVVSADGEPYEIRARQTLCRCGHSKNKPFCDGTHWSVGFRDPEDERGMTVPTVYEWAGGIEAFERLTSVFYRRILDEQDPLLYPIFQHMSAEHVPHVAAWLAETFGGPRRYTEEMGGYEHMLAKHRNLRLTEEQRKRWVQRIGEAADEAGLPDDPDFRSAFLAYIEWGTRIAVANSRPDAAPPEQAPVPVWGWGESPPYVPTGSRGSSQSLDVAEVREQT